MRPKSPTTIQNNYLPSKHPHGLSPLFCLGDCCYDDDEECGVEQHHHEDGEVEEIERLVSFKADETCLVPYTWVEV